MEREFVGEEAVLNGLFLWMGKPAFGYLVHAGEGPRLRVFNTEQPSLIEVDDATEICFELLDENELEFILFDSGIL